MTTEETAAALSADEMEAVGLDDLPPIDGEFRLSQWLDSASMDDLLDAFQCVDEPALEHRATPRNENWDHNVPSHSTTAKQTATIRHRIKGLTSKQQILKLRDQVTRLTSELKELEQTSPQLYLAVERAAGESSLWKRVAMRQCAHRHLAEQRNRRLREAVAAGARRTEGLRQHLQEMHREQVKCWSECSSPGNTREAD